MSNNDGNVSPKTIVLLVGASGTGKTTIANRCEQLYGLKSICSYTTRPRRNPNECGHIFVNKEEFDKLKDLVAYTSYNEYEYCATAEQVEESDIYIIDPDGVEYFKAHYKGTKKPVTVFLTANKDPHIHFSECYERIKNRGETIEAAAIRTALDYHIFADFCSKADFVFSNENFEDLDRIASAINDIVQKGCTNEQQTISST